MLENNQENLKETNEVQKSPSQETQDAVNEVESQVAQSAENDDSKSQIPMLDYAAMELEQLAEELQKLLKSHPVQHLKNNVDAIKNSFNSKFGKLLAEKKEAFLAEGGESIDFQFSSPVKTTYNKLLGEYKKHRDQYYSQLESQLKENLEKRNSIIEELKSLIQL